MKMIFALRMDSPNTVLPYVGKVWFKIQIFPKISKWKSIFQTLVFL